MTMKFKFLFLFTLFYCVNGSISQILEFNDNLHEVASNTTTSVPTVTSASFQDDYLDKISIQDVLSSDIDSSEKIEKKIINAVTEYSSNCLTPEKMDISAKGFVFPTSSVTINLGLENATFHNFRITESSNNRYKRKSYSILIGCDSSKMAKIEVKLPNNIEISADLTVTKINSSSNAIQIDTLTTGSIILTLKNNSLSKQVSTKTTNHSGNYESSTTSKLLYSTSEVSLEIDTRFQMAIYNKLEKFFNEIELPIRQFLIEKLDVELVNSGISVAESCSKFMNADKSLKKVNLPFFNNNLNNLYVIQNVKLETWKGIALSAGPLVIEGLSSFNSTELFAQENEISRPDGDGYYYLSTPRYDDPELKQRTIRIKTNFLKGKLDWSYNSKQRSFPFTLEFIQFEIKKDNTFRYESKYGSYYDGRENNRYYPHGSYVRYDENKTNVNLYLGNIQIKSSKSGVCENESEFVNFVLSEYLKTVIADSLKNSLAKKLQNESLFVNCV